MNSAILRRRATGLAICVINSDLPEPAAECRASYSESNLWDRAGAELGRAGSELLPSWGRVGADLGPSWGLLSAARSRALSAGPIWGQAKSELGPSWTDLGPSWTDLGPSWDRSGSDLGPSWGRAGPTVSSPLSDNAADGRDPSLGRMIRPFSCQPPGNDANNAVTRVVGALSAEPVARWPGPS